MSHWLGGILIALLLLKDCTHSLRLVEVRIPNYVIKGSAAQLECLYDLDGDSLYSVKWYKDGNEFYRYLPRDMPPAQTFLLPGVLVDLHNSSDAVVMLRDVNLQSSGRFRCEVSGEAPSFQTVTENGDMIIVSLPDQAPKISGGRPRYQIGDWVRVNCTAGRSKPAVQLSWYVNGELAEPHTLRAYETIVSGREALETSVLGLQFRVEQQHFRNGDMKLKCVASLSTFYWRSNEESVEGDRPLKAPVLESRETVYASNSRADPVQANKTDALFAAHAPSLFVALCAAALAAASGFLQHLHFSTVCRQLFILADKQTEQQQQQQHGEQQEQHKAIRMANEDKRQFVERRRERSEQNESTKPAPAQVRRTKSFNKEMPIRSQSSPSPSPSLSLSSLSFALSMSLSLPAPLPLAVVSTNALASLYATSSSSSPSLSQSQPLLLSLSISASQSQKSLALR